MTPERESPEPSRNPGELAEWARETAPTLTDEEWQRWLTAPPKWAPPSHAHREALLAFLDRIAGDLSDEEFMLMVDNPTPLGSAVLQRVEGQR